MRGNDTWWAAIRDAILISDNKGNFGFPEPMVEMVVASQLSSPLGYSFSTFSHLG